MIDGSRLVSLPHRGNGKRFSTVDESVENRPLTRREPAHPSPFDRVVGRSPTLRRALVMAARVAPMATPVLITGESGTGKELVAQAIHFASRRAHRRFLPLNCAAITETLIESELFGHERGAFTGAERQKPGRFELAAGGTLFLDEVAELSTSVQAKLLRVLQDQQFERVGGTTTLQTDVRIVAATNDDLGRAVERGKVRADLFYRLNVFPVHLPSLRERGDDVLLLAEHFVDEIGNSMGKGGVRLSDDARELLMSYSWPGNVRELRNAIERALILSDGDVLTRGHFMLAGQGGEDEASGLGRLATIERAALVNALREARNNRSAAARLLGISRFQLYTRLRRFGLMARNGHEHSPPADVIHAFGSAPGILG